MRALKATDLSREVVLEKEPVFPAFGESDQPAAADRLRVVDEGLNRVAMVVEAKAPAILVLADMHYPGWKALVAGRSAELFRANYCFRAVALALGSYRVEFVFRPHPRGAGLGDEPGQPGAAGGSGPGLLVGRPESQAPAGVYRS